MARRCPKCLADNPETKGFCHACGAMLLRDCPQCGSEILATDRYCGECGLGLSRPSHPPPNGLSFDEKLQRIQKYLPGNLVGKILAQRGKIEGERRLVTVMFADMEGFTPLVEKIGPEDAYSMMDRVFEILIHKVYEYDGTVNKMTGDGIMALFGAPIALEDAPQRAIRSAYAIHREMERFSERIQAEQGLPPIRMRIGLHTGPVVVGTLGNNLRVEFTAVGETVNLASRMEGLAEPGTTYVTEDTFKLAEGLFRFEFLGDEQVKGRETPVKAYRVISPTFRRTRFDVSAERGLTPFVDREHELELLLDGFERMREGRGQAFSIVGEAGVGKSRLLYEFRKAMANQDVTLLEGKCLSYGRGIIYHPIIDILKLNFDIREGDDDAAVGKKFRETLKALRVEEAAVLPYLLDLLSVKNSGLDRMSMSPEARQDRTIEALKRTILKVSEMRPLALIFEDLHWIDRGSEDCLKYFLEVVPGARVLLILTYRPEFVPAWSARSYYNQITLNPLRNAESLSMAAYLLGTREIEKELERVILEKTDGVPFFIEELLKSLKDLAMIERKGGSYGLSGDMKGATIPSTLHDMIMARVDTLPDPVRTVLQTAAVIEREFTYDLIQRVTGVQEEQLLSDLSALKDAELIYQQGVHPGSTFIFRHALTREVLYHSILSKKRKQIHKKIGRAIEECYPDRICEHLGALVNHFTAGEDCRKAATYARLACEEAQSSMSLPEAADYARKWIVALETLPATEALEEEIIAARTALGFCLFRMSSMAEAREAVDPVVEAVVSKGSEKTLPRIYLILGSCKYMADEDFAASIQYLEKAIESSKEAGDFEANVYANYMLGLVLAFNCDFEKAIPYFEALLKLSIAVERTWRVSLMKSHMSVYGYAYHGLVAQGYETSTEAVRIAEESGDIYSKAVAYVSHGITSYYRGLLPEAEEYLVGGAYLTEKISMPATHAVAHQWLGHVYFDGGQCRKAQDHYSRVIEVRESSRLAPSSANLNRIALARAKLLSGERDTSLEWMARCARENKVRIYDGCMARYIADIFLHLDEYPLSTAEGWIGKAIAADQRNGMACDLGRDYALYGDFFVKKGEPSKAVEFLEKAIGIFLECGADGWARKTEQARSQLGRG
jgi:class 3 adenylate cyclase/tetratricopeptide (TPR) repeat protein